MPPEQNWLAEQSLLVVQPQALQATSVNVVFYNVRKKENKKIAEYFGIQMIPVQILLDIKGKEFFRHVGYYSFNELSIELKKT